MTRRIYKNPPIEEALCEIHFASTRDWDMTIPFLFREKIKHLYSGKTREQNLLRAGLQADLSGMAPTLMLEQGFGKIQFLSEDEKQIVGVGKNLISVHVIRPYPGWEHFEQRILEVLGAYIDAVHPSGVTKLGLRYINKIEIKASGPIDLAKYFVSPPWGPTELAGKLVNFIDRHEYVYNDNPITAVMTFGSVQAPKDVQAFLLDIDLIWQWTAEPLPPPTEIMQKINDLRTRERVLFESLITDVTREVFDAT